MDARAGALFRLVSANASRRARTSSSVRLAARLRARTVYRRSDERRERHAFFFGASVEPVPAHCASGCIRIRVIREWSCEDEDIVAVRRRGYIGKENGLGAAAG